MGGTEELVGESEQVSKKQARECTVSHWLILRLQRGLSYKFHHFRPSNRWSKHITMLSRPHPTQHLPGLSTPCVCASDDRQKVCGGVPDGGAQVFLCLQDHMTDLKEVCRTAIFDQVRGRGRSRERRASCFKVRVTISPLPRDWVLCHAASASSFVTLC